MDAIFKCIFLKKNGWIPIKISLKFVPKGPINNIPALVHIMAWRCPGDKPLYEPMMVCLLTHICVTRPQWVNLIVSTRHFTVTHAYLQDDDCEEGEIKEPGDRSPRQFVKPLCRFYTRGHCTWGDNCRFLHPGVNDKGKFTYRLQ